MGIASPAFAEFLETGTATNNAEGGLGNSWTPAPRANHVVVRANGLHAFAMVAHNPTGPALTGGGSVGYNENLRQDQW